MSGSRAYLIGSLIVLCGCESSAEQRARLRTEADTACAIAKATKQRLDSAFGYWMTTNPDTLLQITAAYGDSIEERQARCDAATQALQRVSDDRRY